MVLLADHAFNVTFVSILIWVVLFPVLVQGLILYAVIVTRGEKRDNDRARAELAARTAERPTRIIRP